MCIVEHNVSNHLMYRLKTFGSEGRQHCNVHRKPRAVACGAHRHLRDLFIHFEWLRRLLTWLRLFLTVATAVTATSVILWWPLRSVRCSDVSCVHVVATAVTATSVILTHCRRTPNPCASSHPGRGHGQAAARAQQQGGGQPRQARRALPAAAVAARGARRAAEHVIR